MKYSFIGLVLLVFSGAVAQPLRLVSSGPDGLELELVAEPVQVQEKMVAGRRFDDLAGAEGPRLAAPGQPALPYIAELLASPPGAQVQVEVLGVHYREYENVWFVPAPYYDAETPAAPRYEVGAVYDADAFFSRPPSGG